MWRGTDSNTTTHWEHTNQALTINRSTNIRHLIDDQLYYLIRYAEEDNLQGSDWVISHINYMTVLIINDPFIRPGS